MEKQNPMDKIYFIPTDKKILTLTLDDGPEHSTTPIILDILKNYNIKATFFVLMENVLKNPDILKRTIQEGHTIGLHGYNHKSFRKHPKLTIYRHIKKCMDMLYSSFSVRPVYFRPPYGTLTPETEIICNEFNMTPIGWSIMEKDWQPNMITKKSNNFIKKCSPGKIIVLHDGYRNFKHEGTTIEISKLMLPQLLNQGYSFVSIPELVASKSHSPHKTFNDVPLLHNEIIDYECYNQTTLFLYWDVNCISTIPKCTCPTCGSEIDRNMFQLKILNNNETIINKCFEFPSPNAMESWHKGIELPLKSITNNSEIFIAQKQNDYLFVKL